MVWTSRLAWLSGLLAVFISTASCGEQTPADPATEDPVPAQDAGGDFEGDAAPQDSEPPEDADGDFEGDAAPQNPEPPTGAVFVEAEPQRGGDPERGYDVLLEGAYVGCGLPDRVWTTLDQFNIFPEGDPAPGSTSGLPYYLSRFETSRGAEVVGPNCLACHAGNINGQLVIGLPGLQIDYGGLAGLVTSLEEGTIAQVADALNLNQDERFELNLFAQRMTAVSPYVRSDTAGIANPADNLAAILFSHRDPETLEWHDEPLFEPPPTHVIPVDTPPWWHMSKKNAMFYSASGRGDHARIMMSASTLCVDEVEVARQIDETMGDVRAFILSLQAPAYPFEIDDESAGRGERVFAQHCQRCHGTYGPGGQYPNLLIPVELVGTDAAIAEAGTYLAERFVDWFNNSFYGETARLEPSVGYVAPPLDGVWATAPYLHNGSVPTLGALLDSARRPVAWQWSFNDEDYDNVNVGWNHEVVETGGSSRAVYDTTRLGYGNGGHTFGDALTNDERADLIEYLKTL